MKKILIIPTFNERENIKTIYKKIRKYNKNLKILFIDDNSPDRTIDEIIKLKKKDKKLDYILRMKKTGIGSAHKFGIKWAAKNKYNLCITMDSDLTHNPQLIPKMIKFSSKYHLVQTNRFLDKNSLRTWPVHRRILTKFRYILLNVLLNISCDSSGAFRCYNFDILNYKLLLKAKNNSYSFFWESIYILTKEECKIKELKMVQKYRVVGSSKLKISDWLHGLYYLFEIFLRDKFKK